MHDALREKVRVAAGREPTPSAGSIDSQSVKSARTAWIRGFDARKKINGIKRHIVVDTLGLLLLVVVHSSAVQDRDGANLVLVKAGGGYAGKLIDFVGMMYSWILQIVKRSDDQKGFKVLPRRWVVERTFG